MTDNEIIKALECCRTNIMADCKRCNLRLEDGTTRPYCTTILIGNALDLINRLQAENERLKKAYLRNQEIFAKQSLENERLKVEIDFYKHSPMITIFEQWKKEIEAEAYKECIEKVKERLSTCLTDTQQMVVELRLDNLLKELVGEDK